MEIKKLVKILMSVLALSTCNAYADGHYSKSSHQGPWLVRVRAVDVVPFPSSNNLNSVGGRVDDMSAQVAPELDISYFITPHVAAELILATSKHTVKATGTTSGTVDLGSAYILPPTLTIQYHFMPDSMIRPYLGAGLNFTHFYRVEKGPTVDSITYANSFGPSLQVGADFMLNKQWSINADIKKVYVQSNVNADLGSTHLAPTVRLNPIIFGLGVGYRFAA